MCAPAFLLPSSSFKSAVGEEKTQLLAVGDFFSPFWKFPPKFVGGKWTSKRKTFICFLGVGCDCVA